MTLHGILLAVLAMAPGLAVAEPAATVDPTEGLRLSESEGPAPEEGPLRFAGDAPAPDAVAALIEDLRRRRETLERWEEDLAVRAGLLQALERRIEDRLAALESLREAAEEALARYERAEHARLDSVVAIYERMRPREAARIFDAMALPVLVEVVERMREARSAPILGRMDAAKAEAVTAELARRQPLEAEP